MERVLTIGTDKQALVVALRRALLAGVLVPALALAQAPVSAVAKPPQAEIEAEVRELRHAMALHPDDAAILYRLVELFGALAEDYEVESGRQLYQAENALRYAKQVTRANADDPVGLYWFAQASLLWGATNGVQNSVHLVPSVQRALDRCLQLTGTAADAAGQSPAAQDCQRLRSDLLADWPTFPVSAGNPAAAEKLLRALQAANARDVRTYFVALPLAIRANNVAWVRELTAGLSAAVAERGQSVTARSPVAERYLSWKAADVLSEAQQWLGYQKP